MEEALGRPALFQLIFARPFPWADLRAAGLVAPEEGLRAWNLLVDVFRRFDRRSAAEDARVFHAALHGIAALTLHRRMNAGDLGRTDRAVAGRTLRRLVRVFQPGGGARRRAGAKVRTAKEARTGPSLPLPDR